jgi:hypothetical protein
VGALLNRVSAIVGSAGLWPNRWVTLEVRGRRTGRPISFPLVMADYQGERYLVAMLGEHTKAAMSSVKVMRVLPSIVMWLLS